MVFTTFKTSEMFKKTLVLIIALFSRADGREIKCRPYPCYGMLCLTGCGTPPHIGNMKTTDTCLHYPIGAKIWYKCDENHHYAIAPSWCGNDGKWTKPNHSCNPNDCGPPPQYEGFVTVNTRTTHRSTATFSCDGEVVGAKTVTCHRNGRWMPQRAPRCHSNCRNHTTFGVNYLMLPMIKHGKKLVIGPGFCKPGYRPRHSITSVRCKNGRLNPKFPCEHVHCGVPKGRNGIDIVIRNGTKFGSKAFFRCNGTLEGNTFATCLESGKWHYGNATCHRDCMERLDIPGLHEDFPHIIKHSAKVNAPLCAPGFKPNIKLPVICRDGVLTPRTLSCDMKIVPEPMMLDVTHVHEMNQIKSGCSKTSLESALIFSMLLSIFMTVKEFQ